MTEEHPNAALTRRVFGVRQATRCRSRRRSARDIVWRVPGNTVMSGEYHGRRDVVEFLRRPGSRPTGRIAASCTRSSRTTNGASPSTARGATRNGIDLDVEQAFVIRFEDGMWKEVTAVPLDAVFDAFWA